MQHGGEVHALSHVRADFSVNVNPLGAPVEVFQTLGERMQLIHGYPDQSCGRLTELLGEKMNIDRSHIFCGNGASEVIQLLTAAIQPKKVLLTAPSFSGYARAARSYGAEIEYVYLKPEENFAVTEEFLDRIDGSAELVVLCSPANPVGNTIGQDLFGAILKKCHEKHAFLLADECFIGFLQNADERSMRKYIREGAEEAESLMVVDAFTKRYAMPGLRLGYGMSGNTALLSRMKELQPEWSVSALAQAAGEAALNADEAYLANARSLIAGERQALKTSLEELGFKVFDSEANFLLFETEKEIFKPLLDRGILIRHCGNYEGLDDRYYRTAVKTHLENSYLVRTLQQLLQGH